MNYNIAYLSYDDKDQELKNRSIQILDDFFKSYKLCYQAR